MGCPIGPEWRALKEKVGPSLAYRIYAANEEIPSNIDELIKDLESSLGGAAAIHISHSEKTAGTAEQ